MNKDIAAINIFYFSEVVFNEKLNNILWGLEEEEIPYTLFKSPINDANILGSSASKASKLGVGIGISEDIVTLYHEKLDKDNPLFKYSITCDKYIIRSLGINGARLIKGNPFIIP